MTTQQNVEPTPKLALSINEVCARVPCGRTRLYAEIKDKKLRVRKIGSRTIILAADLDAWLAGLDG